MKSYPASVYIHDTCSWRKTFHLNGKPTPYWHSFPCREVTLAEARAEGATPCIFCFNPKDYQ